MDYIIIDYLGIKEKILSSDTVISNVFSGPVRYDFNITINYSGLTLYKLKNYFLVVLMIILIYYQIEKSLIFILHLGKVEHIY